MTTHDLTCEVIGGMSVFGGALQTKRSRQYMFHSIKKTLLRH